ncbi:ERI1 exoribonuclease 2-like, partial [Fagus crenata]
VDKGVLLSEALLLHDKWLKGKGIIRTNFAVVTWSNWDCQMDQPEGPIHEVFGAVKCNLKEAVQLAGLVWEGRAHCGLDDAKNTAHLLAHIMHRGFSGSWIVNLSMPSNPSELSTHHCLSSNATLSRLTPVKS